MRKETLRQGAQDEGESYVQVYEHRFKIDLLQLKIKLIEVLNAQAVYTIF